MSATLTAKETAKRLGISYKHFLTHWREWVDAKAFPPPLFPTGRPVWSAEMVDQVGRGLWANGRRVA